MLPRELRRLLPPSTVEAWAKVAAVAPDGSYLAGGTALAVHLMHRVSRDLDVFVARDFDPEEVRTRLAQAGTLSVTHRSGDTLNGVLDGTRVRFLRATQQWLDAMSQVAGLPVAGVRDLMADKLKVVGDRGELRDYFDLMTIEQAGVHRVEQGLAYYRERYHVGPDHVTLSHIVRGLGYLDDVADDPGLPLSRDDIERYWRTRQPQIARNLRATFPATQATVTPPGPAAGVGIGPSCRTMWRSNGTWTAVSKPGGNLPAPRRRTSPFTRPMTDRRPTPPPGRCRRSAPRCGQSVGSVMRSDRLPGLTPGVAREPQGGSPLPRDPCDDHVRSEQFVGATSSRVPGRKDRLVLDRSERNQRALGRTPRDAMLREECGDTPRNVRPEQQWCGQRRTASISPKTSASSISVSPVATRSPSSSTSRAVRPAGTTCRPAP